MTDRKYYKSAKEEYDSGKVVDELMTKSLAISEGDTERAKWNYIEQRAKEIEKDGSNINFIKLFFILLFFPLTIPYYLIKLVIKHDLVD